MTDIELRLTADLAQATKSVGGFRKEYSDLVRTIEKPLRNIDVLQQTQESAKRAASEFFAAKRQVEQLKNAMDKAGQPVRGLSTELSKAERQLAKATLEFDRQKAKVREQRTELKAAGVDTRDLAAEQQRLQAEMAKSSLAGRREQAVAGIRAQAAALAQVTREQKLSNVEQAKAALGVSGYRQLQAELARLNNQYQLLRTSGNLTARELAVAQQTLTRRIRETNQALNEASSSQARAGGSGVGGAIAGVAGGFGVLEAARGFVLATDSAKKMEAQLNLATTSQEEFNVAQAETFRIAQENQAPIADVVTLYSRLAPALRDVGKGQGETLKIIEAVTKSLRISGATAQETASTIQQFSQALGSGVLRGEEFNTLAESSPRLLRALADGLNVNVGALRAMAAEGQLTADVISNALIGQLPKLTREAAQLPETFAGSATKFNNQLVAAITTLDKFTGASNTAIGSITKLSGVLGAVSQVKEPSWLEKFGQTFRALGNTDLQSSAFSFLLFGFKEAKTQADDEAEVYDYREGLFDLHRKEMQIIRDKEISGTKAAQEQLLKGTEAALKAQVKLEQKAAADLEKAKKTQLDTQKRYSEALANISGGQGDPSYGAAESLKIGARQALQSGDVEGAKSQAQAALKVLQDLAAAGESTYGFQGFIKELQQIEDKADAQVLDGMQAAFDETQQKAVLLKAELEKLKVVEVTPTITPEAEQALLQQMTELAALIGQKFVIQARVLLPEPGALDDQGYAYVPNLPPVPQFATGGRVAGPGTGTSDSILARLSNGEFVMRADAVSHYGPELLAQMNARRLPKFAEGGYVSERALPAIPAMNPALMQSANPLADWGRATLDSSAGSLEVLMRQDSFDRLLRRTAMKHGG
jgi:tape measure domain-containing protein